MTCVRGQRGGAGEEEGRDDGAGRASVDVREAARVRADRGHDEPREPRGHPGVAGREAYRGRDQAFGGELQADVCRRAPLSLDAGTLGGKLRGKLMGACTIFRGGRRIRPAHCLHRCSRPVTSSFHTRLPVVEVARRAVVGGHDGAINY